jgi:branched-chain amino acid transport system ATP-binding protein
VVDGKAMNPAVQLNDIAVSFGGVRAVDGVTVSIASNEFVGLIGPNGAGKTTLVGIVSGKIRPDRGRIVLEGKDVTGRATAARVREGLAITHQLVRPFRDMTVLDNVVLAAGYRRTTSPLRALLHMDRRKEIARATEIIRRVGLRGTEAKLAGSLPLGQMKRLEVARALALDPRVLLLDEPLAGLNQVEAAAQVETITALHAEGMTILLIEHNLEEVTRNCRRLVVMNEGRVIADGAPDVVMADAAVLEAYVGKGLGQHAHN